MPETHPLLRHVARLTPPAALVFLEPWSVPWLLALLPTTAAALVLTVERVELLVAAFQRLQSRLRRRRRRRPRPPPRVC